MKFNKAYGQCTYIFRNGAKYVGEVKAPRRNLRPPLLTSIGIINYTSFKPEQLEINCHGQGPFTWANGDQYIGEWKDGKKHGKGTKTYNHKTYEIPAHKLIRKVEKGIWMNDLFIGKASVIAWDLLKLYPVVSVKKNKESLTIEDELLKIKELYEKDLITEEVYKARQISILESYK